VGEMSPFSDGVFGCLYRVGCEEHLYPDILQFVRDSVYGGVALPGVTSRM
jgi:hypothetical protein